MDGVNDIKHLGRVQIDAVNTVVPDGMGFIWSISLTDMLGRR